MYKFNFTLPNVGAFLLRLVLAGDWKLRQMAGKSLQVYGLDYVIKQCVCFHTMNSDEADVALGKLRNSSLLPWKDEPKPQENGQTSVRPIKSTDTMT